MGPPNCKWYFRAPYGERGPITEMALRKFAAKGVIDESTLVRREGRQKWTRAGAIKGLDFCPPASESSEAADEPPEDSYPYVPRWGYLALWIVVFLCFFCCVFLFALIDGAHADELRRIYLALPIVAGIGFAVVILMGWLFLSYGVGIEEAEKRHHERIKQNIGQARKKEEEARLQRHQVLFVQAPWRSCRGIFGGDLTSVRHAVIDAAATVVICLVFWYFFLTMIILAVGMIALVISKTQPGLIILVSDLGVTWTDASEIRMGPSFIWFVRILGFIPCAAVLVIALFRSPLDKSSVSRLSSTSDEWLPRLMCGDRGRMVPQYRRWCAWAVCALVVVYLCLLPPDSSASKPPKQWILTNREFVTPHGAIQLAGLRDVNIVQRYKGVAKTRSGHTGTGSVQVSFTFDHGGIRTAEVPENFALSRMPDAYSQDDSNALAWEEMLRKHFPGVSLRLHEIYEEKYANTVATTDRQVILIQGKE